MKKIFQYTRMVSQRRLFAFEMSAQQAAAYRQSELDLGKPVFQDQPNPTIVEGQALRRKIADAEYEGM